MARNYDTFILIPLFNPEDINVEDGRTAARGEQWQRWILETLGSKYVESFSSALGEDDLFFRVSWGENHHDWNSCPIKETVPSHGGKAVHFRIALGVKEQRDDLAMATEETNHP